MSFFHDRRPPRPKIPRPRKIDALETHMEEQHGLEVREGLAYQFEGQDEPDEATVAKAVRRMHNEQHWQPHLSDHDH